MSAPITIAPPSAATHQRWNSAATKPTVRPQVKMNGAKESAGISRIRLGSASSGLVPIVPRPPGHLRKPVVEGADHREDVDADQDVVDVGDDEIGLGELPVDRCRAR